MTSSSAKQKPKHSSIFISSEHVAENSKTLNKIATLTSPTKISSPLPEKPSLIFSTLTSMLFPLKSFSSSIHLRKTSTPLLSR